MMEYLDGETLEDRIRKPEGLRLPREGSGRPSGLPIDEALFLPDGRHFLFLSRQTRTLYISAAGETEPRPLLTDVDSYADFVPPGYLLFVQGNTLMAQRFDPARLEVEDVPFVVSDRVQASTEGAAGFSASRFSPDGKWVVYSASDSGQSEIYIQGFPTPGERVRVSTRSALQPH